MAKAQKRKSRFWSHHEGDAVKRLTIDAEVFDEGLEVKFALQIDPAVIWHVLARMCKRRVQLLVREKGEQSEHVEQLLQRNDSNSNE